MTPADLHRIKASLTVAGLAKVLRVSRWTVYRWLDGTRKIDGPASIVLEMLEREELPERYR